MDTEERIQKLEARVAELERMVADGEHASGTQRARSHPGPRDSRAPSLGETLTSAATRLADFLTGEGALARVGITLLLGGLLFLVKYGIDQGWLNETVRVLLSALAGMILITLGERMSRRRLLSQVLVGGGVGALYVAVFSAHVFYGLIGLPLALAFASIVSVACLGLSLRYASPALASVALAAAISTPFVLSSGEGTPAILAGYLMVVFVTSAVVFIRARWLLSHAFTALLSLAAVFLAAQMIDDPPVPLDQVIVQLGVLVFFCVFWVLPLFVGPEASEDVDAAEKPYRIRRRRALLAFLTVPLPLMVWLLTYATWDMTRWPAGFLALGLGVVFAGILFWVASQRNERFGPMQVPLVAAVWSLLGVAALVLSDGEGIGLLTVLGVFALLAHRYLDWKGSEVAGQLLALVGALGLFSRLMSNPDPVLLESIFDGAGVVGLAILGWQLERSRPVLLVSWFFALLYLEREFSEIGSALDLGPGLATAMWAVLAIALLALGFRTRESGFRYLGMATVGLVVGKLVFFDLDELEPLWRILVFLGIGIALLATSYFFPQVWEQDEADDDRVTPKGAPE